MLPPCVSHASIADEVELLNVDGSHFMLFWSEEPPCTMKVQTSSDGGASWSGVRTIAAIPPGYVLADFDGIYTIGTGGRLIASVAVDKGPGQARDAGGDDFRRLRANLEPATETG